MDQTREIVYDKDPRKLFAYLEEVSYCISEGLFMKSHTNIFFSSITSLKNVDVEVNDKDQVMILLFSFPL